jgi:hypothetical protein
MARGTIKEGETTILEDIELSLTTGRGRDTFTYWHGSFRLPKGKYIDVGGPYQLILDDGRAGEMIITRANDSDVQFQGSGELKKPEPPEQDAQQS